MSFDQFRSIVREVGTQKNQFLYFRRQPNFIFTRCWGGMNKVRLNYLSTKPE